MLGSDFVTTLPCRSQVALDRTAYFPMPLLHITLDN